MTHKNKLPLRHRDGLTQQIGFSAPSPGGEGWGEGDQRAWLNKIKDQIAEMTVEDFNYIPFNQEGLPAPLRQAGSPAPKRQAGGLLKARELFGKDLDNLIQELNGYLIA